MDASDVALIVAMVCGLLACTLLPGLVAFRLAMTRKSRRMRWLLILSGAVLLWAIVPPGTFFPHRPENGVGLEYAPVVVWAAGIAISGCVFACLLIGWLAGWARRA